MSDEPQRRLPTQREVSLVEVLDRALGAGVVISGDITLSLADIDLVDLHLRLVIGSVPTLAEELSDSDDEGVAALPPAAGSER